MSKSKKEEKQSASNSLLWAFAVFVAIVMLTAVCSWFFRDFEATGYVNAVLDQHFKGDVNSVAEFVDDKTEAELLAQYEEGVISFVQNNITSGVEVPEDLEQKYIELGKDIFLRLKYTVKDAERISRNEYRVPVEYQTMNVFPTFIELVKQESQKIKDKVEAGEYKGTVEEINAQMQEEFLNNAYDCLNQAYEDVTYEEKETMIFTVKKNKDKLFEIEEDQIYDFTTKILGLDEIQD